MTCNGNPIFPAAISGFASAFTRLYQTSGLLNICPGMRLWLCAVRVALAVAARRDIANCSIVALHQVSCNPES